MSLSVGVTVQAALPCRVPQSLEQTVPHQRAPDPGSPSTPDSPRLAGDQVQPVGLGGSAAHPLAPGEGHAWD